MSASTESSSRNAPVAEWLPSLERRVPRGSLEQAKETVTDPGRSYATDRSGAGVRSSGSSGSGHRSFIECAFHQPLRAFDRIDGGIAASSTCGAVDDDRQRTL